MLKVVRQNPMIAAGILLPLIVVIFFVLATAIPRWLIEPPQYDFVFTSVQNPSSGPNFELTVQVENAQLTARAYKKDRNYRIVPRLFLFDHKTQRVREVAIDLPTNLDSFEDGDVVAIPDLAGKNISTDRTAPDGYEVRGPGYNGRNLMMGLFGGRRSYGLSIHKSGAVVDIPDVGDGNYYYYNANFIGWLTD